MADERIALHAALDGMAAARPTKVALRAEGRAVTFEDLRRDSARLAGALARRGIARGDRIAIVCRNRIEWVVTLYASARLGAIVVPMHADSKPRELAHMFADTEPKLVVCDDAALRTVATATGPDSPAATTARVVIAGDRAGAAEPFERLLAEDEGAACTPPELQQDDLVFLLRSSGTTGTPKTVMLSHGNLVAIQRQYVTAGAVSDRDVSLVYVPLCHVYGLALVIGGVCAGATSVLMERYSLAEATRLTREHGVTLYYALPTTVAEMAAAALDATAFSTVRYINCGGALPRDAAKRVRDAIGVKVVGAYGLTEAAISGVRIPGEERRVVDLETGEHEVPPGQPGELILRGPHVMKGYWRDPAATARAIRDGWLYTGDIAVVDDKGRLKIVDRRKDLIKYKGFAIAPSEIEDVLREHEGVLECAVVGAPDAVTEERPVAFVVLREGAGVSAALLAEFVAARVAHHKRLHRVELVPELPRNTMGKLDRRALRAALLETEGAGERSHGA